MSGHYSVNDDPSHSRGMAADQRDLRETDTPTPDTPRMPTICLGCFEAIPSAEYHQHQRECEAEHPMSPAAETPDAPVRLCCGQRHDDIPCPDGKVMCCLCFGRFDIADLNEPTPGYPEDVCRSCAEQETRRA